MKPCVLLILALAVTPSITFAQSATVASPGLALLQQVSQRYVDALSYHIEAIEVQTSNGELQHSWRKSFYSAAEAPGNRYYFAGKSNAGSMRYISDGKTEWAYEVEGLSYTSKSASPDRSAFSVMSLVGVAPNEASTMKKTLARTASSYKSATQLPDETIVIEDKPISCAVIRITSSDLKHTKPDSESVDEIFWIDRARTAIVKDVKRTHITAYRGTPQPPRYDETTTVYTVTEFDLSPSTASLFSFNPPTEAKLVTHFTDSFGSVPSDLVGRAAPSLTLHAADGKQVSLQSFRGKPVLIDFWATWCEPCMESMPKLAETYQKTKGMGLVMLTIDKDEEGDDATDFLNKKHYEWLNFHADEKVDNAFGQHFGIPRTLLIDAKGIVVYDHTGSGQEDELNAAVAKLGSQYVPLASHAGSPCPTTSN